MALGRRQIIAFVIGSVVLCGWCSLLSGVGGWVMGYDLAHRESRALLLPETGVLVVRVVRDSPADQAGIQPDDTIVAVNGAAVSDVPALRAALARYRPGDSVDITYRSTLGERVANVHLGRFPGSDRPYLGIYYTARADEPADI